MSIRSLWSSWGVIALAMAALGLTVVACAPAASPTTSPVPKAPPSPIMALVPNVPPELAAKGYAGSEICGGCHTGQYETWRATGHPVKLRKAQLAKAAGLPLPEGYTWDDISYVIGGYKWKARYVNKEGYIITSTKAGEKGKNQYNLASGQWGDYEAGKTKPYDCASCHTTGYSSEGHQGGLPGIAGTWVMEGIQCERCHGPGLRHVTTQENKRLEIKVDTSPALCGECHIRGVAEKIPAADGFIQHHEQYNEFVANPHKDLSCITCHNPHRKASLGQKTDCGSCHNNQRDAFAQTTMGKIGVSCTDCHMPKVGKSAVAAGKYQGDVRTHLFKINTDPKATMFTEDGKFANGYLTVEYVCLNCHQDKDKGWALGQAKKVH